MVCYMAPLEGITDSIYRSLHQKYFPGIDRYYTPFFSPTVHRSLTPRERRELPPADTWAVDTVVQVLTKVPEDFLWFAEVCHDLGYRQINLNLGCPSGTVTAKGKGAGMLRNPEGLDRFLSEIYGKSSLPVSIKTRLGFSEPEEFTRLLDIFNQYPVAELTIHPRVRQAFYNGDADMQMFRYAAQNTPIPLCCNGNFCSREQINEFAADFPNVSAVMVGRGLIGDPGMLTPGGTTPEKLEAFLEELLAEYTRAFGGSRNAMFRLKENWRYLFCLFQMDEKVQKQLRKTTDVEQYRSIVRQIIHTIPIRKNLQPDW